MLNIKKALSLQTLIILPLVVLLCAGPLYSYDTLRVQLGRGDDTLDRMEEVINAEDQPAAEKNTVDIEDKTRIFIAIRGMRHGGTVFEPGRYFIAAIGAVSTIMERGEQSPEVLEKIEALDTDMRIESENFHELLKSVATNMDKEISPVELKRLEAELVRLSGRMKDFASAMDVLDGQIEGDDKKIMSIAIEDMALMVAIFEDRVNFIKKDIKKEKKDINAVINEAQSQYRNVTFSPGALPEVEVDLFMIQGAIANILKNNEDVKGIKHTNVSTRLSEDGRDVIIEIADDGPGFPAEFLVQKPGKAYQEAFEFGSTKREGGTGFGLAEARWYIMEDHSGSICVTSDAAGSAFIIRLPVLPVSSKLDGIVTRDQTQTSL